MDIDINFSAAAHGATRTKTKAAKVASALFDARADFYAERDPDGYWCFYTNSSGAPVLASQGVSKGVTS